LPSSIGASSNAAANLVIDGGTLRYTGAGTVTDRALTAGIGGATLDASGTGALVFNSPAATALTGTDTARTITLTGTSTGGNTLAATIGNNGAGATTLSKTGAGRWIVSGANTYSGGTTITNGVLSVQNTSGSGTGTGPVTASTGGTLGGTGTIGGAVTINSGGRLAPGASVGTLTVGSLSLATGAILDYEFSVGPANDLLVVSNSGGLTLNSAAFNLFAAGTANTWSNTGTYNLIQYSGAIGGIGLDATWTTVSATNPHILNPAGGRTYGFGASGGFITLTISTTANLSTWNVNAGGSWGAAGNWTAGIPNGASDTANFLNAPNSPQTILLDGSKTVGSLQFANPNVSSPINAYTIGQGSGGSLILDNGAAPAQITVVGSDLISAPVSLVSSAVVDVDAVADTLTISGAISGAALSKSGNGTLTLTAPNSHSATSLQGGAINVGNPAALGAGALTFSGNGTLVAGVGSLVLANNAVIGNGVTATINPQATTLTLAGIISNTNANGALRKTGPGTLVLSGANTYGGATTLEGGTLSVSALANGGLASNLGQSSSAAANLVLNGATLAYTGAATTTDRLFTIGTAGGTLDASGTGALELTNVGALALAGTGIARTLTLGGTSLDDNRLAPSIGDNLTGATSLSKTGPGTWILASANSFTGATVISGGILAVGHPLALQNSTLDYNSHGGSLAFRTVTAATLGNLNGGQNLDLNNELGQAVALTVGNAQNSFYAGQLSDGFAFGSSLTKIGNGSLTLSGANSYAGATTLNAGLLQLAPGGVIAGSGVQINSNATLTVSGGSLTASGTGNLNSATGGVAFNLTSGSATFNAGLNALANANQNWVINATGGTLTTSSMSFGRSALVNAAEPAAGVTGTGLYINGAAVHVTGALTMGTTAGANSAVNARIDSGSLLVDGPVTIGLNNGGRWSIIDVNGGTFTSTDPFGGVFIGGPLVGNAKFLVRAGTATAELIRMGQAASGTSVIELTGGSLYVGSGGIVQNSAVLSIIKLAGGTLGAKDTWTSPIDMQVNGNPTIKAADAVGAAHDITLGGALSGGGTLTKTGAGILTLSGSQLYAVLYAAEGTTNVTGSFTTGASIVNVDARLNFSASQTLSDLNIGAGATVTLTASPSPEEGFALANEMSAQGASPASQITAVPEPGALGMLAFGALGILARRRRA
jgi:autotransporter-associated beta strand protein